MSISQDDITEFVIESLAKQTKRAKGRPFGIQGRFLPKHCRNRTWHPYSSYATLIAREIGLKRLAKTHSGMEFRKTP